MGNHPYYPDEGDKIWCVFDRDDNTNEMLDKARKLAAKEGYEITFSNPSFELWFLLHFQNQTAPLENCDAVIRLLKQKGRLEQYEKNLDVYAQLKPLQTSALEYARHRLNRLSADHIQILSRQSNPVTTVGELVEYLNQKQ